MAGEERLDITIQTDRRPLYVQAQDALAALLARGAYQVGDKLPPEPLLAQQLGISRSTLREALRAFEADGRVKRVRGRGTFVLSSPYRLLPGLETLLSVDELLQRNGLVPETDWLQAKVEPALPKAARRLHVPESEPLLVVDRTCRAAGKRVAYTVDVVPRAFLPVEFALPEQDLFRIDQLWRALANPPRYAHARLFALAADASLAQRLEVPLHVPLLFVEQQLFADGEEPVGYGRYYFVGDLVSFQLVRRAV